MCCPQTAPYLTRKPGIWAKDDNDQYEGYCADLTKEIAGHVGFSYLIKPVADGQYGSETENGSWNGMVGELIRHVS